MKSNEIEYQKTVERINRTKSCFSEINKNDKPLLRLIREKKIEKTHISNIRNKRGGMTIDSPDNKRIIREFYEQLYANKSNNLDELSKFLEGHIFLKLTRGEIVNLNNLLFTKEIEFVNYKNLPTLNSIKHLRKT